MRRAPTASSLLVRLFTGLITVWCLGCSGFDPLLDSLVGSSSDMICGSAMTMSQSPMDGGGSSSATTVSEASSTRGFDCGCGWCSAASPQSWNVEIAPVSPPTLASMIVIAPPSVTRSPIAPPPESRVS